MGSEMCIRDRAYHARPRNFPGDAPPPHSEVEVQAQSAGWHEANFAGYVMTLSSGATDARLCCIVAAWVCM